MPGDDRSFLGVGWAFPVALDGRGCVALATHEEDIRQSIRIILGTNLYLRAIVATGEWDSFRFALEAPPASQLALQDLALVNDTGESTSDKITTDSTIKGKVGGTAATGSTTVQTIPIVEIDQNNDGLTDGSVTVVETAFAGGCPVRRS